MYFGPAEPLQTCMGYFSDPAGGLFVAGPGSAELARFCASVRGLRVRSFRLEAPVEGETKNQAEPSLRERYAQIVAGRGPGASDGISADFGALLGAEADCLLFVDNKFGPRTREASEADNRLTAALI